MTLSLLRLALAVTNVVSPAGPSEYQVKAAFLFNFIKFVDWPAAQLPAGAPVTICVLGDDPFGTDLDETVEGRVVNGRRLLVRRLERARDAEPCHVLFIAGSEEARLAAVLDAVKATSILTIGDMDAFAAKGGMIQLTLSDKKVRFEINREAAERAGVRISSQLLRLATAVHGNSPRN
jgi:hypothetical protein